MGASEISIGGRPVSRIAVGGSAVYEKHKYAELEYIESTGTQWIVTDIAVAPDIECDCEYVFLKQVTSYPRLFGSQNQTNSRDGAIMVSLERNVAVFGFRGLGNEATLYSNVASVVGHHYRINCHSGGFEVWDIDTGDHDVVSGETGYTDMPSLRLFGASVGKMNPTQYAASFAAVARISSFKVSYGGSLAHSLVPVRRTSDGALGMYDKVTKHFYPGSGAFIAGAPTGRYY